MSAGEPNVPATCKHFLQVRLNAGGPRAAPLVNRGSVVKDSLTTRSRAVRRRAATIKFGLMVAQIPGAAGHAVNATNLRALEDRITKECDQ